MRERPHIKLEVREHQPTIIYLDQISSVISLGFLGTKIVLKELDHGTNVVHIFSLPFNVIEEEIRKAEA
jgi:hypothetical protein